MKKSLTYYPQGKNLRREAFWWHPPSFISSGHVTPPLSCVCHVTVRWCCRWRGGCACLCYSWGWGSGSDLDIVLDISSFGKNAADNLINKMVWLKSSQYAVIDTLLRGLWCPSLSFKMGHVSFSLLQEMFLKSAVYSKKCSWILLSTFRMNPGQYSVVGSVCATTHVSTDRRTSPLLRGPISNGPEGWDPMVSWNWSSTKHLLSVWIQ